MTHNQKVLRLLNDGRPHTHHELYNLGVVAHSRVADLRKMGHTVLCWTETVSKRVSVCQLGTAREGYRVSGSVTDGDHTGIPPGPSRHGPPEADGPKPPSPESPPARQLSVFEAAA